MSYRAPWYRMFRASLAVLLAAVLVLGALPPAPVLADDGIRIQAGNFLGQYYDNFTLSGNPVLTRSDAAINFTWGDGSPGPAVPADRFSARWIGSMYFSAAGTYTFKATSDDGVRLWVDNVLLLNQWNDHSPTTFTVDRWLGAGSHTIKVEYYENVGQATISVSWGLAGSSDTFNAEFFNNTTLSGTPVRHRIDDAINFDWGYASPDPNVNIDYFSARWSGVINFPTTADYDFHLRVDDGARLYVDNVQVLNKWILEAPTDYLVTQHLSAGPHEIKLEYFENNGVAVAKLWWNVHSGGGATVVVDELSPQFTRGGAWHEAAIGYNGHMFYTYNAFSVQENWGRWKPALGGGGMYDVQVFVPSNYATTTNARYSVYHNGQWNTRSLNQFIYSDVWVSLGTFGFSAAGDEFVFLPDVTGEPSLTHKVGYDAVKFVYVGP